jgi:hypothetical protein
MSLKFKKKLSLRGRIIRNFLSCARAFQDFLRFQRTFDLRSGLQKRSPLKSLERSHFWAGSTKINSIDNQNRSKSTIKHNETMAAGA